MWAALAMVLVKEVAPLLIKHVLVPEVLRVVKRKVDEKNGNWPTEDEVFAELAATVAKTVSEGEAFLARTPSK